VSEPARLLIVGLGNPHMGDDGVGPAVLETLAESPLPGSVRLVDGATDATSLATLWNGEPEAWLVDAFARGAPAGAIHRLDHDQLLALPQRHSGAHALSLPEALRWVRLAYPATTAVRLRLWGIEPDTVAFGQSLSEPARQAVRTVAAEILREIAALGLRER
jgi:hydrogenase maturation protease